MTRARRGMSLVEVVFTFLIVAGLLAVLMDYFLGSQKQAVKSETRFNAVTLAQMVIERVKSRVAQNPAYINELTGGKDPFTSVGMVVDAGGTLSPFFKNLFAVEGQDLYSAATPAAILPEPAGVKPTTEIGRLAESLKDYRVEVTLANDIDLESKSTPTDLKEMVKRLSVVVSRASIVAQKGKDPDAFALTTRLVTPMESLSLGALNELYKGFEGENLEVLWGEFFGSLKGDNPYFQDKYLSDESKKLLADCYIVLGTLNTEAFLTEGKTVAGSMVLTEGKPSQAIKDWIKFVDSDPYKQYAVFKRAHARLLQIRTKYQFDAFKRIQGILKHLSDKHDEMMPQLDKIIVMLKAAKDAILQLNQSCMDAMKSYRWAQDEAKKAQDAKTEAEGKLNEAKEKLAAAQQKVADAQAIIDEGKKLQQEAKDLYAEADKLPDGDEKNKKKDEAKKKDDDGKKKEWDGNDKKWKADAERQDAQNKVDSWNWKLTEAKNKSEQANKDMEASLETIRKGNEKFVELLKGQGTNLMDVIELVVRCKFLKDFFQTAAYRDITDRLKTYPDAFVEAYTTIDKVLNEHLTMTSNTGTPLDQVAVAQALVENTKIKQLYTLKADPDAVKKLSDLGDQYASKMASFASYLKASEVHNYAVLGQRNWRLLQRLEVFRNLNSPDNPTNYYGKVRDLYVEGGKISEFIKIYTEVAKEIQLDSGNILAQLQSNVMNAQGAQDYIGQLTQDQILKNWPQQP